MSIAERARASWPPAAKVGSYFAGVTFLRVVVGLLVGNGARPIFLLASPALAFVIFALAIFTLLMSGAVKHEHLQLTANPWFSWAIIGALIAFVLVLITYGHSEFHPHIVEYATLGAAAWTLGVSAVWLTGHLLRRGA